MKISAGILPFRWIDDALEVLLVHPGGPFWAKKDEHAWGFPKGLLNEGEAPRAAAGREFSEETGLALPADAPWHELTPRKQPSGKLVYAWAVPCDCDPALIRSNTFELEWPPQSGRTGIFPEIDRAAWFTLPAARQKIQPGLLPFLDELLAKLIPH